MDGQLFNKKTRKRLKVIAAAFKRKITDLHIPTVKEYMKSGSLEENKTVIKTSIVSVNYQNPT